MVRKFVDLFRSKSDRAVDYYKNGNALNSAGRWREAVSEYDRAIALDVCFANAYCNRGTALQHLGRLEEALASYERAAELNKLDSLAFYNRGSLFREMRRLDDALVSYERCIALQPDHAEAYINRGNVLQELNRHEDAIASYNYAIELGSVFAEAFQNRGFSLVQLRQFDAAVASYDRAIEIDPTQARAFQGRLYALVCSGRFEAAIETYNRELALEPDQRYLAGLRLHAKMQICDWEGLTLELARLEAALIDRKPCSPPFPLLSAIDSPSLHRIAAELWVRDQCPPDASLNDVCKTARNKKIRIGYFSSDFRSHAVSQSMIEVFEMHDRGAFELIAFAFGPRVVDATRVRLQRTFDRFIDVSDHSDMEVVSLSRELGIDIAVDLGGYTEYSRSKIFAARAAPIQINYLGYPGTMGAPYIDYLIADMTVVPPEDREHYRESIVYLPNSYLPHDSTSEIAARTFTRSELGLPEVGVVFCCFNKKYKITPEIFQSWMRLLTRTPGSVLWLSRDNAAAVKNLRCHAVNDGIASDRLVFSDRVESLAEHLARLRVADLFLDTTPYNAHATAMDALWAGLPVLALTGRTFASRVSASLLISIGLPELIASTIEQYEHLAVSLANDPQRIRALKLKLERNRLAMPLFNTPLFVEDLQRAYRIVHDRYLAGLAPDHIVVANGSANYVD